MVVNISWEASLGASIRGALRSEADCVHLRKWGWRGAEGQVRRAGTAPGPWAVRRVRKQFRRRSVLGGHMWKGAWDQDKVNLYQLCTFH